MWMTGQRVRNLCGLEACPSSPPEKEEQMLLLQSPSSLFVSWLSMTLTLETVTTIFELHQSFLLCPLQSEGERMVGISLDQGERERNKRGRQMMD